MSRYQRTIELLELCISNYEEEIKRTKAYFQTCESSFQTEKQRTKESIDKITENLKSHRAALKKLRGSK